jgi:hypothetical protein
MFPESCFDADNVPNVCSIKHALQECALLDHWFVALPHHHAGLSWLFQPCAASVYIETIAPLTGCFLKLLPKNNE